MIAFLCHFSRLRWFRLLKFSWMTIIQSSCRINTVAAADLTILGTRSSAALVLTLFSRNISGFSTRRVNAMWPQKMAPFCIHFEKHFLQWKKVEFRLKFPWSLAKGSNSQQVHIGSGNGLAPTRWQCITWTSDDPVPWHMCFCLGLNGLNM